MSSALYDGARLDLWSVALSQYGRAVIGGSLILRHKD